MGKHTPGPWVIDWNANENGAMIASEKTMIYLAVVYRDFSIPSGKNRTSIEAKADAYLIAAAPDLLEACKVAIELLETINAPTGSIYQTIKQAIAKAKGE